MEAGQKMNETERKSILRKLQLTQLEILEVIDKICTENNIQYSLYAGSLLGAVRHQGFIPWDDDLDICMERNEYDRFIRTWLKYKPPGYIIQNKDLEPGFTQSFTKIRKDHTTFLQEEEKPGLYHQGIFVDVFPIDRQPDGIFSNLIFKIRCMFYQLYTREFIPSKSNILVKTGSFVVLKFTPLKYRNYIRKKLLHKICMLDSNRKCTPVFIETIQAMQVKYPADLLDAYITLPFEKKHFMCFKEWEIFLKRKYGNYMKLPPEEERVWKHSPVVLDFEHNYEEIV